MREPVYIYDGNIDKLQLAVEKLNKRAAKLCVPAIQLHISPRETCFTCVGAKGPTVSTDPKAWGEDAKPVGHERAEVILRGEPPKLAGWTFAAVVDHLSNGCITRYPFAGGDIDLTPYRGVEATCDHCSTARKRHETFIVVHDTGTEKRVGRNCLADFLGHSNPASLIGHINLWGRAFALVEGAEEAGFGTGVTMLEIHEFLGYVACQMREHGWCSRGKAYEEGHHGATADLAQSAYWSSDPKGHGQPQTEDLTRGKKALAWARALTDSEVESNDYLYNLRAVCTDDYIRPKRGGLAGSVIVAAERAFEKAAEKAAEATKSNLHVGATGERLTQDLKLVSTREIAGFYGVSTLHRFEDAAGNLLSTSDCAQSFVAGEMKVILFKVTQNGSPPQFALDARLKARGPNGRVQTLNLSVPSVVHEKAKGKPFHGGPEGKPFQSSSIPLPLVVTALAIITALAIVRQSGKK